MLRLLACVLVITIFIPHDVWSQQIEDKDTAYVFRQKVVPEGFDTWDYVAYYFNLGKVYNLLGVPVNQVNGQILSLTINPDGKSCAVLYRRKGINELELFDLWSARMPGEKINVNGITPKAMCWSSDGNILYIADDEYVVAYSVYDGEEKKIEINKTDEQNLINIVHDKMGKYLFLAYENWSGIEGTSAIVVLDVANSSNIRKADIVTIKDKVNSLKFSEDGLFLGVIAASGRMRIYDVNSYKPLQFRYEVDGLGIGEDCAFHPEGKYIAAVSGNSRIAIVNTLNPDDRKYIDTEQDGIARIDFVREKDGGIYLLYNTSTSIVYEPMYALSPFYTRLLEEELDARMNEWMRQMPGESLEDYHLRVNEETKAQQVKLFRQEIATRMADNMLEASNVTLDNFNTEIDKLEVGFDNMPSIYLDVPSDEVNDFMDPSQLEFHNTLYGLNSRDEFEVIYTEVYNPKSGKTYTFDNRAGESLDYLAYDDGFVPLELVQMSNMEEIKLQEIKNNIVNSSLNQNIISNHTQISVSTKVLSDVDENGEKFVNYQVEFSYNVEKGFSEREDFAPGQYKTDNSGAAKSLAQIIQTAFTDEFAQYMIAGHKLVVTITGMADMLRINGKIAYDGIYGEFENMKVNGKNGPFQLSVTSQTGIQENEQLAFIRAAGIKDYIVRHVPQLSNMDVEYRYNIVVSDEAGGEYRRISVDFLFVDVF